MVFQANYLIISDLPGTPDGGHDFGLCSRDTTNLTLTPRQSWYAFRDVDKTWPPLVDFSADVTVGPAPLTVQFTDQSANSPTEWAWEFGDGGVSDLQDPSHVYTAPGAYTVSLTASGPAGSRTATKTGYIVVTESVVEAWRSASGAFSQPFSVSVNPTDGSCWVADTFHHQVVHLDQDGDENLQKSGSGFNSIFFCWGHILVSKG